jgi:hypothetical protein
MLAVAGGQSGGLESFGGRIECRRSVGSGWVRVGLLRAGLPTQDPAGSSDPRGIGGWCFRDNRATRGGAPCHGDPGDGALKLVGDANGEQLGYRVERSPGELSRADDLDLQVVIVEGPTGSAGRKQTQHGDYAGRAVHHQLQGRIVGGEAEELF